MPQKNKEEKSTAFKHWISPALVNRIAQHFSYHHKKFDQRTFIQISKKLKDLEMKDRVRLIAQELHRCLDLEFTEAVQVIRKVLQDPKPNLDELKGFDLWPVTEFIHTYGLDHWEESMQALYLLTQKFTSEFSVRPFIRNQPQKTLKQLQKWSKDPNVHVRRWTSEGSRPRLPWGEKLHLLIDDPSLTLPILENLKYDSELYVRKSVANHLNDITKDHPDLVIAILKKWIEQTPEKHQENISWISQQALRTLIKKGNAQALQLLGYKKTESIHIQNFSIKKNKIKMGEYLEFEFELISKSNKVEKLMVDYIIHHKKANGSMSPKVFKLKSVLLKSKQKMEIRKRHAVKPITTRVYYSGIHKIEIMVNGTKLQQAEWVLQL